MLRFPNPGSNINNVTTLYRVAYKELNKRIVRLDHIVRAVVNANLATSSGYMGDEAIHRSFREDRSRDPLYNQLKMYAEIYRSLGWLLSTSESALEFTFTPLGGQIVIAESYSHQLLEECVLGINFPNRSLNIKGVFDLRPFALILKVMLACDNGLSRDEMILGPLSAKSDRTKNDVDKIINYIRILRSDFKKVQLELELLSKSRSTQINTLRNYTRWPIGLMRDLGWTEKTKFHASSGEFYEVHKLTSRGVELANKISNSVDIRVDQLDELSANQKESFALFAYYKMLERSGFDLSSLKTWFSENAKLYNEAFKLLSISDPQNLLFSPFQSMGSNELSTIFNLNIVDKQQDHIVLQSTSIGRGNFSHLNISSKFTKGVVAKFEESKQVETELLELYNRYKSIDAAADHFFKSRVGDSQRQFYPLVSHLFQILGFSSHYSRQGVNYQRWDACVWIDDIAIPIEVKSPTEEMFLATKAIRQAMENKIILVSRGGLKTNIEVTSLIVGYQLPNDRGEMPNLIDDIFETYGIRIGVIDLKTLVQLALMSMIKNISIERSQLINLKGFLNV